MSGGSLNYFYTYLEGHVGDLGDKELDDLVGDLAELFRQREWYLSADTGIGDWKEARDAFKEKWFTKHGREERIEHYLKEITDEIRDSFGLKKEKCQTCEHWHEEVRTDSRFGKCDFVDGCLMHRSESCDDYKERRDEE